MSTHAPAEGGRTLGPDAIPVVVIVASAGGLASLRTLLENVPGDTAAAFVVALHRLEDPESRLVEILGRATGMPIAAVDDGSRPEPGRIVLCPPAVEVTLERGVFRIVKLDGTHRWLVDELFASVAREVGPRSVGVVLSGSGSAGTRGLGEIRAAGGFALAEDPGGAEHVAMPQSAVQARVVDVVADPEHLGGLLSDFVQTLWIPSSASDGSESELEALFSLLRTDRGRDFRGYKRSTLIRRIRRRMALRRHADLETYVRRLERDSAELDALVSDLTIKVSGFFRDPEAWHALDREILAPLVADRPDGSELRVWVPACASGEEAYSLAILMAERAARARKSFRLQIFATDCHEAGLDMGRAGLYPEGSLTSLDPDRLARHFVPDGSHYRIRDLHRDAVVFSPHDLLQDPPLSRMDLVSCRNLLIYLEPEFQERVLAVLHFALRDGGGLFLGRSESAVGPPGAFRAVAPGSRIFRRIGPGRTGKAPFPVLGGGTRAAQPAPASPRVPVFTGRRRAQPASRIVEEALLSRYAPAAVLVDDELNILYFHGETARFLAQPRGELRQTLLEMARAGLRAPLRRAVLRAAREGEVGREEAHLWQQDRARVRLTASPVPRGGRDGPPLLVTFELLPGPPGAGPPAGPGEAGIVRETLKGELGQARDELQTTLAELEASNEELRASNEEITSMNEELQATNEELQTSQDELQSVNEELATVNVHLEAKVTESERATNDLRNLLASSRVATVFLDRELRIRMFTPEATRMFAVLPGDVGRPLQDLRPRFEDPELLRDTGAVLGSRIPREAEVRDREGRWHVRRVLPYRTEEDRFEGVVVTFHEVTDLKRAEQELDALTHDLERRVERRTAHLRLLQDAAVLANSARSLEEAAAAVLERVCRFGGWAAGHAYWIRERGVLEPSEAWYVGAAAEEHEALLRETVGGRTLPPGAGLPGRVVTSGQALSTVAGAEVDDPRLPSLEGSPLAAVVAFPVLVGDEVVGVLEFLGADAGERRAGLLKLMVDVGTQLGRVVERDRADRKLADLTFQEQQRLGEELHEGLGQQVSALAMLARSFHKRLSARSDPEADLAGELEENLQAARKQVHRLSKGLMPVRLLQKGLTGVLEELAEEVRAVHPVDCDLEFAPGLDVRDDRVATALYRIAREAVNNALRHAEASRISIRLARLEEGLLALEVVDDGKGLRDEDPEAGGLGLRIMRDRAALVQGELVVEPAPDAGTRVECRVQEGGRDGSP